VADDSCVVRLRGVSHQYRRRGLLTQPLRGVDLDVPAGVAVGVSGPSGTGKSTLLRIAAGIERPSAGTVDFGEGLSLPLPPGYVMTIDQNPLGSLDPRWSIRRTLGEPLLVRRPRLDRAGRHQLASSQLDSVGLGQLSGGERPGRLSIGQCQRIAVLRALAAHPTLIVADEPTSALDVMSALSVVTLLRSAVDAGAALLVVSHDRNLLGALCDTTLNLDGGILTNNG